MELRRVSDRIWYSMYEEERVMFFGDCISGVFPTWERDPAPTQALIKTLRRADADCFIGGHWPIMTKEQILLALET